LTGLLFSSSTLAQPILFSNDIDHKLPILCLTAFNTRIY
jgi:hypothetical protein